MSHKDWWTFSNGAESIWNRVVMASVINWPSIVLLHNVIKTLNHLSELPLSEGGRGLPVVTYRGKTKIHGTNCAVQVHPDGLVTQSREIVLTPEADLKGFSKWVKANEPYFRSLTPGIVVYGEWCGSGVEAGMAISALEKQFCVFGLLVADHLVYAPEEIKDYLGTMPKNMHILPWMDVLLTLDYTDPVTLQVGADALNDVVLHVEKEDPWVKSTFGVSGMGEGVVLYPVAMSIGGAPFPVPSEPASFAQLMFKAKGDKHRTAGTKEAVQVAPEVVSSVGAFVTLMVTEARLQQGLSTICGGQKDSKLTREFLQWMADDTKKESVAELDASDLTWDQVKSELQTRAREWFLKR